MSYLVDALKKAEQERRAEQHGGLSAQANAQRPASHGRGSGWYWLIAALIATNVALVGYVWRPHPADDADTVSRPDAESAHDNAPIAAWTQAVEKTEKRPRPERRPVAATVQPAPGQAADAAAEPRDAPTRASLRNTDNASEPNASTPTSGSVRYASRPLTGGDPRTNTGDDAGSIDTTPDATANDDSSLADQADLSVPSVTINGQLYSSQPGRSFILVGGRRYHEGERLVAGPAVESIEPDGAILRYRGQRYRVAGPG